MPTSASSSTNVFVSTLLVPSVYSNIFKGPEPDSAFPVVPLQPFSAPPPAHDEGNKTEPDKPEGEPQPEGSQEGKDQGEGQVVDQVMETRPSEFMEMGVPTDPGNYSLRIPAEDVKQEINNLKRNFEQAMGAQNEGNKRERQERRDWMWVLEQRDEARQADDRRQEEMS